MSDDAVRAALRSEAQLVVIEAPAGCGKTHQGADYAREVALTNSGRLLILTHTHAACSVFAERTKGLGYRIEIRTLDSVIAQIAGVYHLGLGLPADVAAWVRSQQDGHAHLALKVAKLVMRHPFIATSIAARYHAIICDEHQDSSGDQHALISSLVSSGIYIRIFADPMQRIFREEPLVGSNQPCDWQTFIQQAHAFEQLDTPHRWASGCPVLGQWTLDAREALKNGRPISLVNNVPPSVTIVFAENQAPRYGEYQLSAAERRSIDGFERGEESLLILTAHNRFADSLRSFFNRRLPLWEGYTRPALDKLVGAIKAAQNRPSALAVALVTFMSQVGKGFSPSGFGNALQQEAEQGCTALRRGKPATIQALARLLVEEPDHRGVSKTLERIAGLRQSDDAFSDIEIDSLREFKDAIKLGDFADVDEGLAEITHRRSYSRPNPPTKAISTIHKAKGLECGSVIVMPCDANTFPERAEARCLLYVALSRAKSKLMLVVSRDNPSPLLGI